MTTTKRRGFGSQVDALLDGPAAPMIAPADAAPTVALAADVPGQRTGKRSSSSRAADRRAANVDQVDDDGPRLRASAASRLANRDVLTVRRTVYVGADDWRAVLRLAQRRGVTASDVTRAALADYLRRHGGGSSA